MTAARIAASVLFLLLAVLAISLYIIGPGNEHIVSETRLLMGTIVQIKVAARPGTEGSARGAMEKAFREMGRIENVFSVYKEDSEISRINRLKAGERLAVTDEVFGLIKKSVDYNKKTKNAFDITVKPLLDLWRAARTAGHPPSAEEIDAALGRVGYDGMELDDVGRTISFKKAGMGIDLGGIAKGYAVQMAVKALKENGIMAAVVHAGGDMYCLGEKAPGKPWKVGVQHPRARGKSFAELRLKDKAVDTSGDYERYFTLGERRYSHIIDPRVGYPIGDDVVSATVIADDPVTADILATALCILGTEGLDMIKGMAGIDAMVIVLEDGELNASFTPGMKTRYGLQEKAFRKKR